MTNETKVYLSLKKEVLDLISNENRFKNSKIKIFPKQMSSGKSYLQGHDLLEYLKDKYPNIKYIFRISPTNEVADDGTFDGKLTSPFKNVVLPTFSADYKGQREFENYISNLDTQSKFCFSFTHSLFHTWAKSGKFESMLKNFKDKSVLIVEEAHQFIGCGDEGNDAYKEATGYGSPYAAETAKRIQAWAQKNGMVIGFTATPTNHHKEEDGDFHSFSKDMFEICGELSPKEDLISSQAWLKNEYQYNLKRGYPIESVQPQVIKAIDSLFARESQLRQLQEKDPNINTKLTGLFTCGTKAGVWGSPIHSNYGQRNKKGKLLPQKGMVETIAEYLIERGYDEDLKMIATLQEKGSGGNRIWDLSADPKNCESIQTFEQIKQKLLDEKDPLRYLIVVYRARSGISVNNLSAMVIGGIREPALIRTMIPVQVYGRMLRANPGTGTLIMDKYFNNLELYLKNYSKDFNVDPQTMVDATRIANYWDIWYPTSYDGKDTTDTWKESLTELKEYYANSFDDGERWMNEILPDLQFADSFVPFDLSVQVPCNGKMIDVKLNDKLKEWKGDGTLDKFFSIA